MIWAQEKQRKASDIARERHEARQARLERIKQERAQQLARKKQTLSEETGGNKVRNAAIQAALERVKRKKEQAGMEPRNIDNLTAEQQHLIDAAEARRRNKRTPPQDQD